MRLKTRTACLLIAITLSLGSPVSLLAQTSSDTITISVPVLEDPGVLTVSGRVTSMVVPSIYPTTSGAVTGNFSVSVTESRLGRTWWYVMASISPFSNGASEPTRFAAEVAFVVQSDSPQLNGNDVILRSQGTSGPSAPLQMMRGYMPGINSDSSSWGFSFEVPTGLASGTYTAGITLDLYTGDPP